MRSIFQNRTLTVIIILLLVANLAVLTYYAFFKERGPRGKRRPVTEFIKNDLGFDDKQMKNWEEIRLRNKEKLDILFSENNTAKDSFYRLVLMDNLDDSILFDKALLIADRQRAIDMEFFRQFKGIQAMCTPDQLKKFDIQFIPMVRKVFKMDRDSLERR